jgi:hypothetical protein
MRPVRATATRNRVRVKNIKTAFHGGSLDLADFQVTPPLGSSIAVEGEMYKNRNGGKRYRPGKGGYRTSLGGENKYGGQCWGC